MEDRYLGDGVYASFDGYHIILDLRGQDRTTRIALEPAVMGNLKRFQLDKETELAREADYAFDAERERRMVESE